MPDLLLELFSEEIPARMQRKAALDLKNLITETLVDSRITYGIAKEYWTPRRLTLYIRNLANYSSYFKTEQRGPRTNSPEQVISGFLRRAGLESIDQAEIRREPQKGDFYVAIVERPIRATEEMIAEIIPNIIQTFPWSKSMRWGPQSANLNSLRWVRPLQSILCTLSYELEKPIVIEFEVGGIISSNITYGHRFHASHPIKIENFDDYVVSLEKTRVILDAERRKEIIRDNAQNIAFTRNLELFQDNNLLEEVSNLVEWPVTLISEFNKEYLHLPSEVIRLTIKDHQKCFLLRKGKKLSNHFLLVSNIEARDGGIEIARGNAKVINARLSDAKFFWEMDLKTIESEGFKPWLENLNKVTFHAALGSQAERVNRIVVLAAEIASMIGAAIGKARRAAEICKADLSSAMVSEFPELQGIMGRHYAEFLGEDTDIILACQEHHSPLGISDSVPINPVSVTVAIADKLDMLISFWSINQKPTGSKDPYALRRAAFGIIRLILVNQLRLPLAQKVNSDLLSFFHKRLRSYLKDSGARYDLIDAVITPMSDNLLAITRRVDSLGSFLETEDGKNLLVGIKRAINILAAEKKKGTRIFKETIPDFFQASEETILVDAISHAETEIEEAVQIEDYATAISALSKLRLPVDNFFEKVMVNVDDEEIRANRLALMRRIYDATKIIADFSKISVPKEILIHEEG
ncbi:glycine--tRNA ligase subunit beta [Candidatus Endowatersipora endosymbiont of Watersipora subatra]|uniref:glycine--tRNA ligase subunit beta n=1 Tax=Candidatus Endowatersipora endosymbiont of Watersipora subatra TaxID=3077946 RepID=UPI00312C9B62